MYIVSDKVFNEIWKVTKVAQYYFNEIWKVTKVAQY